ncbi:unnamed protein product [Closterium sp. NIES-54]
MDAAWWKKAEFFVQLMELPYLVMRRTDSAAKGMMGVMYDIMLQLTKELDLLLAGKDCKLKAVEKEVEWLTRQTAFLAKYGKKSRKGQQKSLEDGMLAYINGTGCFGTEAAIKGRKAIQEGKGDVMAWWQLNGWEFADLSCAARRALLGSEKVRDLVYVAHNWTVVPNFHQAAAVAGPSAVAGRKEGVVEGKIPTPPLPEGYKLEEDGEVEEDEDDVCHDEWDHEAEQEEGEEEEDE